MRIRRYIAGPFSANQLSGPEMLAKLLKLIISSDCKLQSLRVGVQPELQAHALNQGMDSLRQMSSELVVTRQNGRCYTFSGFDETMEPLIEACGIWRAKRKEWCSDGIDTIRHRDALTRKVLESLLLASASDGPEPPSWLPDCTIDELARAVYLVYEGAKLNQLEELLDLDDDLDLPFSPVVID